MSANRDIAPKAQLKDVHGLLYMTDVEGLKTSEAEAHSAVQAGGRQQVQ